MREFDHGLTLATNHCKPSQKEPLVYCASVAFTVQPVSLIASFVYVISILV